MIRTWNDDVEEGLRMLYETNNFSKITADLRATITSLNGIISKQESRIIELEYRNKIVETSANWNNKWDFLADAGKKEQNYQDKIKTQRNMLEMTLEDHSAKMVRATELMQQRIDELLQSELELRIKLNAQTKLSMHHVHEKKSIKDEIEKLIHANGQKTTEISKLKSLLDASNKDNFKLQNAVSAKEIRETELLHALELKETEVRNQQALYSSRTNELTTELEKLTVSFAKVEAERNEIRVKLMSRTVSLNFE
jgi:hypothetical protein